MGIHPGLSKFNQFAHAVHEHYVCVDRTLHCWCVLSYLLHVNGTAVCLEGGDEGEDRKMYAF